MAKHRFFKPNPRVIHAPRRPWPLRAGMALLVTALCAFACWAVSVVDTNSRLVGWNQPRAEFGAVQTGGSLRVTAFGEQFLLPLGGLRAAADAAGHIAGRYGLAVLRAKPAAVQLGTQLCARQAVHVWPRVAHACENIAGYLKTVW